MDRDECAEWGFCDQLCANADGGYACSCAPGYLLAGKNRCFAQNGSSPLELIFAHEKAVYRMNARGTDVRIIANSTGASGLDFHYQRNMLYWSDAKTKRVSVFRKFKGACKSIGLFFWVDSLSTVVGESIWDSNRSGYIVTGHLDTSCYCS